MVVPQYFLNRDALTGSDKPSSNGINAPGDKLDQSVQHDKAEKPVNRFPKQKDSMPPWMMAVDRSSIQTVKLKVDKTMRKQIPRQGGRGKSIWDALEKEDIVAFKRPEVDYTLGATHQQMKPYSEDRSDRYPILYMSSGAANLGARGSSFTFMAPNWPGRSFSIEMINIAESNACPHIGALLTMTVVPRMNLMQPPENSIVGGQSLGGMPAYELANIAEVTQHGVKMVCTFDDRRRYPDKFERVFNILSNRELQTGDDWDKNYWSVVSRDFAKMWNPVYVQVCCTHFVPRWLNQAHYLGFICPIRQEKKAADAMSTGHTALYPDKDYYPRIPLYSPKQDLNFLPDTDHFLIATNHAWDICRRIRGVMSTMKE